MVESLKDVMQAVPSIDALLRDDGAAPLLVEFGHDLVTESLRVVTTRVRAALAAQAEDASDLSSKDSIIKASSLYLAELTAPSLRPVMNLSGTVLHTNLGRAPLPQVAIEAMNLVARGASNLEFDLAKGKRGDRDVHLEAWICRLTGAEAATVVNNNAAAVLLVLNSLALRKEVLVSRGELIEIGGSFRIPDVMARAGAKLCEVGTTNRTHPADFENNIGTKTALVMKVHTSNYIVEGFTAAVAESELSQISRNAGLPFVVDLGSGTLVDLRRYGLPHEPTVAETLTNGADLVTFSGDKLLGGPQAGIIAGRADLIERIKRNPMKRALRVDKMTIAALGAVLRLYGDPDRLSQESSTLRLLTRPSGEIEAQATRLYNAVRDIIEDIAVLEITDLLSQIGSGAQPGELLPSAGFRISPHQARGSGKLLARIAAAFRSLPTPVIGRVEGGAFILDLRCLDDEALFLAQLAEFRMDGRRA